MSYSVKNVKTFASREWGPNGGFTCTLYNGNKKVATVFEAGDGGEMDVDYISEEAKEEFAKSFEGKVDSSYGIDTTYDDAMEIEELVNEFEVNKTFKRQCKKNTLYRIVGDAEDTYRIAKVSFSPAVEKKIREQLGDKLLEIINLRFA
jgi:hypothetical protein